MEVCRDNEKRAKEMKETELEDSRRAQKAVCDENESLKAEVQKGVEDIASALGDGYGRCLQQLSTAGIDVSGHAFSDYLKDYAASIVDNSTPYN